MDPDVAKKRANEAKIVKKAQDAREDLVVNYQQEIKAQRIREIAAQVRKALEEDDEGRGFTVRLPIPPTHPIFTSARKKTVAIWREICLAVAEEEGFTVDAPEDGEISSNVYLAHFK